jgi:hypothetical protein
MHQELSKDGEDNKLWDLNTTPLDQHTLGLHTSNFCFSINALYRINLERLFVLFISVWFLFFETTTFDLCYGRATWSLGLIKLNAIKNIGRGSLSWFKKIHIVAWFMCFLMNINLQVFYQELFIIHVLMLNVTLLCLTWLISSMDTYACI